MDTILNDEVGCICYMYDILVYRGETEAERNVYFGQILQRCMNNALPGNLTKAEFPVDDTILPGFMIKDSQVHMDPAKVQTMSKWPVPTKKNACNVFLDFPNYDRGFCMNDRATTLASQRPYQACAI